MEIKKVSVSNLITQNRCPRAYHFAHDRRLVPNETGSSLASGSAVHDVIETRLKEGKVGVEDLVAGGMARRALEKQFGPGHEAQVTKFLPGVVRAVSRVPDWVWLEPEWHIEEPLTYKFKYRQTGPHRRAGGDQLYEVSMRPDVWRFVDEEEIEILDFKTTASNGFEYIMWSPQLRYYAVALAAQHAKVSLITIRYLTLPTGERDKPTDAEWGMANKQIEAAKVELERRVIETTSDPNPFDHPAYDKGICGHLPTVGTTPLWGCEYNRICAAIIPGWDYEGVISEQYHTREERR